MTPGAQGSFRLFRLAGINVFLHWSWFVIALIEVQHRRREYSSLVWNALEYLALFAIVLLHEFGHALACRSVGGRAEQIVLWPLGGVAYVQPPQRPGAMLWSIAAGPLVNVVLFPVTLGLLMVSHWLNWPVDLKDTHLLLRSIAIINFALLVFNLLPIYPLDGGQILRSVLWFVLGRARSLMAASIVGFAGVGVLILLAVVVRDMWLGIVAAFILLNCWAGMRQAWALTKLAKLPRHDGFACPSCQTAPVRGDYWQCGHCRTAFDTFVTGATCPQCGVQFPATRCLDCGEAKPLDDWRVAPPQL